MKINKPLCWSIAGILTPNYGLYLSGYLMRALRIWTQNTVFSQYVVNATVAFTLFCIVLIAASVFVYVREMLKIAISQKREFATILVYLSMFAAAPIVVFLISESVHLGSHIY